MANKARFLKKVVIGGIFSIAEIFGGCGFNPTGIEPKDGVYEATNSQGKVWEEKVKDGEVWSGYGIIPIRGFRFWSIGSDVVGNGCSNCDCPSDGINLSGNFINNEKYAYNLTLLEYCTPYAGERVEGRWVRELDNSSLTQIVFRR